MLKYMLDTNICIYLLKHQPPQVVEHFRNCQVGDVVISSITWGELMRGLNIYQTQADFDRLLAFIQVMPWDRHAGETFGRIMQKIPHKANFDTLIASHAQALGLILVTNNETDFLKFNLRVENWVAI